MAHPWMLLALLLLPAYWWMRRLEARPRRRVVSSLLLWTGVPARREAPVQEWERRTTLVLWLELAALAGAILAIAGPRLPGSAAARTRVVYLDRSASLLTREADGRTRGDRLRAALLAWISARPATERFRILTGAGEDGGEMDAAAARDFVSAHGPLARGESLVEGVAAAWTVARAAGGDPPVVATDRAPEKGEAAHWISRGAPSANAGIVGCVAERRGEALDLLATVRNASAGARRVAVSAAGVTVDLRLAAGAEERAVLTLAWKDAAAAGPCLAVRLEPGDELPADDLAWLAFPAPPPTVWRLGPDNPALDRALAAVFGGVRRAEAIPADATGLFVFDRTAPERLPAGPAIVIAAPRDVSGWCTIRPGPRPAGARTVRDPASPLLRHAHLEWARVDRLLEAVFPPGAAHVLVECEGVPLVAWTGPEGAPALWIGFDVAWTGAGGSSDWAQLPGFPIFFANLAREWGLGLAGTAAPACVSPGTPVRLPPGATVRAGAGPSLPAARVWRAPEAGCWRVASPGGVQTVAASLLSRAETDNGGADVERLPTEPEGGRGERREAWRGLAALALLALCGARVVESRRSK